MLNKIFAGMIIISVICGIASGNTRELCEAALCSCNEAVELCIYLAGGICFWGGIMRIAEKSGVTQLFAFMLRPFLKLLFRGLDTGGKAFRLICMNVTANMLGLGNAATPLGIEAMKALKEEEKLSDTASGNMVVFTVLNTASLTLIPSTAAALRLKHGSAAPMEILPCVLITSAAALAAGLIFAKVLDK